MTGEVRCKYACYSRCGMCVGWYSLVGNRKTDVNVQPAVFGYESEVHLSSLESGEVIMYLVDGGGIVRKDLGH